MTNPQGPPPQDPSIWTRPGDHNPATQPASQTLPLPTADYPTTAPDSQPPSLDTPAPTLTPTKKRRRFRGDPVSIILVLVIVTALAVAGLIGGEIYGRNRANSVVAAATECVVQDQVKVSFGPTPFLLQHLTGHYRDISIHTAGHQVRNAKGMTADININDVDLHGNADSKGTIGELNATINWTSEGIQETVQDSIPFIGGLVNSVATSPDAGTIELSGAFGLGSVTVKPQTVDGQLTLQVLKVTAMGAVIPHETAQAALDTLTSALIKGYPLGIRADSVQVTNNGVVAHFSTHNAPIPAAQANPCFAHV